MRDGFEALGRLRLQAIALLLVVFVIGLIAGLAVDRVVLDRGHPPHRGGPPRGLPPDLSEGLDLSADQETRIRRILEESRPRTEAIMEEVLPRVRAVADSVRAEVRAVLNPEQQKVFDKRSPPLWGDDQGRPFRPRGPHDRGARGNGPPVDGRRSPPPGH